jgi:hypothetical protein
VWIDALTERVREAGRTVNISTMVAVGGGDHRRQRLLRAPARGQQPVRVTSYLLVGVVADGGGGVPGVGALRTLRNDLLAAGLVDEPRLMAGAVVLGKGTPAFGAGLVPPLRLVSTRCQDGSDNALL